MWLLFCGSKNAMDFHNFNYATNCYDSPTFYERLLMHNNESFPNPNLHQIEVDLPRTFPDEEFYTVPANR